MINTHKIIISLILVSLPLSFSYAEDAVELQQVYITGGAASIKTQPGSATLIDSIALEQFEYTDIHRILNEVPGVNIQEEDGYGLRPNIGMRGSNPERSKKVTIMEDGILSGPAPYSAPAAYYFPNVSRMSAVEVFKGPSVIQYGPSTVAGAINLVSRAIPFTPQGELDVQLGSFDFRRLNAYYGEQVGDFGYMIEALTVSTEGFKELDTLNSNNGPFNGDTGFERNDLNLKTSYDFNDKYRQRVKLKLGYANETSYETYVGLAKSDFESDPYRRYASSALDNMKWQHSQFQLTHTAELSIESQLTTDIYRNEFSRDWFKLNSFEGVGTPSVEAVLNNPDENRDYYKVLIGEIPSTSFDRLRIGNNGRDFISQGIQTKLNLEKTVFGLVNDLEMGLRLHMDEIERNHTEQSYDMTATGLQVASGSTLIPTKQNLGEATAIALYVKNDIKIDNTTVTLGLRSENIETQLTNRQTGEFVKSSESVLLPGAGFFTQVNEQFGVLAGINKGYTATAPGQEGDIEPEESINYELGFRTFGDYQIEAIAFLNDYSNLKESCSASNGCSTVLIDTEFNGGEVLVYGLEGNVKFEKPLSEGITLPVNVSYTFTQTEFGNTFEDKAGVFTDAGQSVNEGDELAYVPVHRINVKAGLQAQQWQVMVNALYQDEMRSKSGQGDILNDEKIEAHLVLDLAINYLPLPGMTVYGTVDNLLAKEYAVAAQPMGYRPGKPRTFHMGLKYKF